MCRVPSVTVWKWQPCRDLIGADTFSDLASRGCCICQAGLQLPRSDLSDWLKVLCSLNSWAEGIQSPACPQVWQSFNTTPEEASEAALLKRGLQLGSGA